MKKLLNFLNRHTKLRMLLFHIILGVSRITGVPSQIINRAKQINIEKESEYSFGLLVWFIAFKLKLPIPTYNIYHLIEPEDLVILTGDLLSTRLSNFRIAKQFYLLQGLSANDDEFKVYIQQLLQKCIPGTGQTISEKTGFLNIEKAYICLCETVDTLQENDVQAFLVSGTLLGFIREGGLLKHDNDLDIGVFENEVTTEELVQLLQKKNAYKSVYDLNYMVKATHKNGTVIDIFVHYREENSYWHGSEIHRWYNTPFTLTEKEFCGSIFMVPDSPERYLDENYGDWHSPTLFWDYSFDTPNQHFPDTKKAVYYLVERIINEFNKTNPSRYNIENCISTLSTQFNYELNLSNSQMKESKLVTTKDQIVITFGTFDLLHIGHINILKRAASFGNKLIVGVSSDKMNYSKKNAYPVYNEADRMQIIQSTEYVDGVFLEESLDLKRHYIQKYNADVLIMGDDWKGKFDDMLDICDVIYLPRTENISTSETKDSIKLNI